MLDLAGHSAAILGAEVKLGDARELALDLGEHCSVRVAALQACMETPVSEATSLPCSHCDRCTKPPQRRLPQSQALPKQKVLHECALYHAWWSTEF